MIFLQPQVIAVKTSDPNAPKRSALQVALLDWSQDSGYTVDTAHLQGNTQFYPRSLFIDNSHSATAVNVMISGGIYSTFMVAPGQSGVYPIVSANTATIVFQSAQGEIANATTRVVVADYEVSYNTWAGASVTNTADETLLQAARQVGGGTVLAVEDTLAETQLSTLVALLDGTLSVADTSGRASLVSILAALTGTLKVTDAAAEASVSLIGTSGSGAMVAVPAGTANGTALAYARQVRFYLKAGDSVTFTIAAAQPGAPPAATFQISGSVTGPNWDETLSGQSVYVVATAGTPMMRGY